MKWRRALTLPWRDLILLAEAVLTLGFAHGLLQLCRLQRLRRALTYLAKAGRWRTPRSVSVDTLVWAIATAKRCSSIPSTCLSEALTAEALFLQHGYSPELRLGVMRKDGVFQAHAWLELNHQVVIGGSAPTVAEYKPLSQV